MTGEVDRLQRCEHLTAQAYIDPISPPEELRDEVVKARRQPGHVLLHGYVADATTGKPLAGVGVRVCEIRDAVTGEPLAGVSVGVRAVWAATDQKGYFALHVPEQPRKDHDWAPLVDVIFERNGYKPYMSGNDFLGEGVYRVSMEPGEGTTSQDHRHKLLGGPMEEKEQPASTEAEEPSEQPQPVAPAIENAIRKWLTEPPAQ
jgi:hypothetical protein